MRLGAMGALGAVGALAIAPGNGRGTAPDVAHAADDSARAIIIKTAGDAEGPALSAVEGRILCIIGSIASEVQP